MSEQAQPATEKDVARKQSLALYRRDMERLERIRRHYRLRSLSEAARRAFEDMELIVAHEQAMERRREAA